MVKLQRIDHNLKMGIDLIVINNLVVNDNVNTRVEEKTHGGHEEKEEECAICFEKIVADQEEVWLITMMSSLLQKLHHFLAWRCKLVSTLPA